MATMISEHFVYEDFWAKSSKAKQHHIDNTPSPEAREKMYKLANDILEPIRNKYGKPIRINSSYRCPELNKKVGGSRTSQHMKGEAADIAAAGGGGTNAMLFYTILDMVDNGEIVIGQLLWEYGTTSNPGWVHVSLPMAHKKNQVMRVLSVNGKTKYINFDLRGSRNTAATSTSSAMNTDYNSTPLQNYSDPSYNGAPSGFGGEGERLDGIQITTERIPMSDKRRVTNDYKKR